MIPTFAVIGIPVIIVVAGIMGIGLIILLTIAYAPGFLVGLGVPALLVAYTPLGETTNPWIMIAVAVWFMMWALVFNAWWWEKVIGGMSQPAKRNRQ